LSFRPGEILPPFATPTHGAHGSNLKPLTTIGDAIRHIPSTAADHDPSVHFGSGTRIPFSMETLAKTLTCNGGTHNYHPSGLRPYTIRELACLQTFPISFLFAGARGSTAARRQIGNAVPPVLAKVMFKSIVKSLRESDEV